MRPSTDPIHRHLASLRTGDRLVHDARQSFISLCDSTGHKVAQLSRSACEEWAGRIDRIQSIGVVAVIERGANDSDPAFPGRRRCESWEVPLVEIEYVRS